MVFSPATETCFPSLPSNPPMASEWNPGTRNEDKAPCFQVKRQQPIVVTPCAPTPTEVLPLSNVDAIFRMPLSLLHFYRKDERPWTMKDPRKVMKEGLARVLVPYYPMAGRLVETPSGKLCVDCKAQGVLFIEAEADVSLAEFGELKPPIPCREQLLCSSQSIIDGPLLAIQVTMLKCGGFIVGNRFPPDRIVVAKTLTF